MSPMRIQKYLSQKGICSRRKAEEFILKGWVMLNGETVNELGVIIDPQKDVISLDDKAKKELKSFVYLLFYKPIGVVTHSPQYDEKEIKDLLPVKYKHLAPIGRLDKDSEGLILLTNDGVFSKKMLDHLNPHERVYEIKVNKPLTLEMMSIISEGMYLGREKTKPCNIIKLAPLRYKLTLIEGKNRQIRRMIQKVGSFVTELKRISFGNYHLDNLKGKKYDEFFL